MPHRLESGKLRLSPEEASSYCDRLRETFAMALDLAQPVTVEDRILLEITYAALPGDLDLLDCVVATVEAEIESRAQRI